jgi:hypothetical protein
MIENSLSEDSAEDYIVRTFCIDDLQGNIEQAKVSELPGRLLGRSGVIVGESGIGKTSTLQMILRQSISQWQSLGIIPVLVRADKIAATGFDPKSLLDILWKDINIRLPGNIPQNKSLYGFIQSKMEQGKATIFLDDADKLSLSELDQLRLAMKGNKSVFYALRPFQAERILREMSGCRPMKVYIPPWEKEEAEELSQKLFRMITDGSGDRLVFDLRIREYPEIQTHPLAIMANFEQTIKYNNVIPVIMEKMVSELFTRAGLPDPGPLCDPENTSLYSQYLHAVGQALFNAIQDLGDSGKILSSTDLPSIEIEDPYSHQTEIGEKFRMRLFSPGFYQGTIRCPNEGIFIFLAALDGPNRICSRNKPLSEILNPILPETAMQRIIRMEYSVWEYQANLHGYKPEK